MSKKIILIALLHILSLPIFAGFTSDDNKIYQTGTNTGDQLRAWLATRTWLGKVYGRTIVFSRSLDIRGTFTDERAVYHFPSTYGFFPNSANNTNNAVVNFTDMVIHYTGSSKNYGKNYKYTANWTRVTFHQGVTGNRTRSDFFNNGDYTFNFNDVTMVSYGDGDYLHFQSTQTLRDIKIINAKGGLSFEPGVMDRNDTETIINLTLSGVNQIVGGQGVPATNCDGLVRIVNLDWDATDWKFEQRDSRFEFINPIKPAGTLYSGTCSQVREYFTHDVTTMDKSRNVISGADIYFFNRRVNSYDYRLITDALGEIPTQEILKIDNSVSTNYDRGRDLWEIVVAKYDCIYYNQTRNFSEPIDEDIILLKDKSITEPNETTVANYTQIDNAGQLYDYLKWMKIQNDNTIKTPTFATTLISETVNGLEIAPGWDLVLDPTAAAPVTVKANTNTNTNTITVKTTKLLPDPKFKNLFCTGTITIPANCAIDFPYKDKTTDSYVRIVDVDATDIVYFRDATNNNLLAEHVGECGFAYSSQNRNLKIELKKANGDSAMRFYDMNKTGFLNVFRMGINNLLYETMFMPTDRLVLLSIVDSLDLRIHKKSALLNKLIEDIRLLTTEIQKQN